MRSVAVLPLHPRRRLERPIRSGKSISLPRSCRGDAATEMAEREAVSINAWIDLLLSKDSLMSMGYAQRASDANLGPG